MMLLIGCIGLVSCSPKLEKYQYTEITLNDGVQNEEISQIEALSDSEAVVKAYEKFYTSKKVDYTLANLGTDTTKIPDWVVDFKLYGENSTLNLKNLDFENKEEQLASLYDEILKSEIEKFEVIMEKKAKKRENAEKVLKTLRKTYDDVSNITWYENSYFTHYNNTNRTSVYMGVQDNNVWLRLKMSYEGDNWIFFERAYLSYDGNTYEIPFDEYRNKKTENEGGRVWEWIDIQVSDELAGFITDMTSGQSVKMRLSGKYTETRTLSRNEIKAINQVMAAYNLMKN